ncbi:tyrosine recombinase XerS [Ligilactobacillus faecis]|uniref:Tyrosine recombinase XerS n=1 Tax=Ligilactobacillus faecis TaxID=762833 RepID=A0ABV4DQ34_9LACO
MRQEQYIQLRQELENQLPSYVREYTLDSNRSDSTKYEYLKEYLRFFTWLQNANIVDCPTDQIPTEVLENLRRLDIRAYIDTLLSEKKNDGKKRSPTTVNRTINALRSLFKYLTITSDGNDGKPYFEHNVMLSIESINSKETLNYRADSIEPQLYRGNIKFNFIDFVENIYENDFCSKRQRTFFLKNKTRDLAIIALLAGTGARVSEVANADISDVQLSTNTLFVLRKGNRRDSVPIAPWAIPYLEDYMTLRENMNTIDIPTKAVFIAKNHGKFNRITTTSVEIMIKKYSTAFGRPITPHKLRHTLASEIYSETKDLVLVSQQLGQKGTTATALYTHVGKEKQRDILDKISFRKVSDNKHGL